MTTWDPEFVIRPLPDGTEQKLAWKDLQEVKILTTADGDFYFLLQGTEKQLSVPQEEAGALLGRLQELKGFDNEAFIEACACTENKEFLCWTRLPA